MAKIIGIDLGTTNSAMAVIEASEPKIIENKEGARTTPSVVAMSKKGERLAGLLAKRQAVTNPDNTIYSAKRLIGRNFSDSDVQKDAKLLPYDIHEGKGGGVEIKMGDKNYRPAEISAMILQKLKADAEEKLGEKIEEAVITVPAYFDDSQRKATKDAGTIAGFNVRRVINEPTAAALAYGLNKNKDEKIVVYDFGGGTFDVSVLEVSEDTIEVKATGGDTHLGGDDFDQAIINWLVDEFKKDQGMDLSNDKLALQRLKEGAEKAKHELSSTPEVDVNIPFITTSDDGPKHLELKLSRANFEELVSEFVERSIKVTKEVIADAKLAPKDIDEIVLVGGQTRMPKIQEAVKELFGKEPHRNINPDEVVAMGAATQAGIFQGDVKDVLLLDVTPLSLGLETLGGVMTKLIEKNTTVPVSKSQVFSTAADNQPSVEIHVLQGEREMSGDNKTLGRFILDGLPPAQRGVPQVEVKFDIDANGILNVSAKDKATNKEQSIRIEASSDLSEEDIDKMKKDAELHADEDKKKRELVDLQNQADALVFQTEKTIKDAGDKVADDVKKTIEDKLEGVKKVTKSENADEIKTAIEALSQEMQKVGADLYKAAEEAKKDGDDSADDDSADKKESKDEEKVKGEYEEKNEKKKGDSTDGEEKKDDK